MFCEKSHVCFATTMEKTKQNEANNVIKNEKLWSKLMSTIMGHNTLVPYSQTLHEHIYGGQNDHFHCRGNYYIIMGQSRSNTTTGTLFKLFLRRRRFDVVTILLNTVSFSDMTQSK
ncbi:uncharacterized protein LOC130612248 [Hydractinia symbiolongicarpus]|uniref:uncharacterized protein LOC130612248 n=1 Tax=Hydractinia symbiolongicarpus TaxID=13093 RepID=UPI00254F63A3|nr:uncharacterized protein LOC130612248 [Hydractinia symbiolongicarpus]